MTTIENIRRLDAEGRSGRQIATDLGIDRETVAKYLNQDDFSPQPPAPTRQAGAAVLAGLTPIIEQWLTDDARRPRKQRHTSKRVYDRLVAEHDYQGSYSPVQRFIKDYKTMHRASSQGFFELEWAPGHAQVDFGQAEAIIDGIREILHLLVITFPFSNMRFAQAFRGETSECIGQGLATIFHHINTVPVELILDNATGAGRRCGTIITEAKLFAAFKAHYRTTARYCNPYSGHEKGNVENAVGFIRRNFMVPEPTAVSLAGFNSGLLAYCDGLGAEDHWKKGQKIQDLFDHDIAAGLALPGTAFDAVRYESRKTDKTGTIVIDGHSYLAGPDYHNRLLTVAIRHDSISILNERSQPVIGFDRAWGQPGPTVFTPDTLLAALMTKPGAWSNSPVRAQVPDPVRDWADAADSRARSEFFGRLDASVSVTSWHTAVEAADRLIRLGDDPTGPGLPMLARRLCQGSEPPASNVDLSLYDRFTTTRQEQPA